MDALDEKVCDRYANFKIDRYKKLNKFFSSSDNILDNSIEFINKIKIEIIIKFISIYLFAVLNRYKFILFIFFF